MYNFCLDPGPNQGYVWIWICNRQKKYFFATIDDSCTLCLSNRERRSSDFGLIREWNRKPRRSPPLFCKCNMQHCGHWTVFRIHPVFLLILILIFRIRSGFLADPDPDSGKKFDPDPEKKSESETLVVEMAGSGENVYTNKEHSFEK